MIVDRMLNVTDEEMDIIIKILKKYASDCEVLVFGSRLKGNNGLFSDLDLAFKCNPSLNFSKRNKLIIAFEDSELPYNVDIVDYNRVSLEFKNIIDSNNLKLF
jgi:predicted nucleotidyltransferase